MGNFLPSRAAAIADKRPNISQHRIDAVAQSLSSSVLGQSQALQRIQDLLTASKSQTLSLAPFCTMLFLGPPNMGKTPTCKALAKFIYGSEENCYRINFKEFSSLLYVDKLKSTFAQIAKGPGKVVILYDIDSAHQSAVNVVEDIITGSQTKLNFNGCIFVFTVSTKDDGHAQELHLLEKSLSKTSVEALSQNVVPFHTLERPFLRPIVENAWEKIKNDVLQNVEGEERGIRLSKEEVREIEERFFDERVGWLDRPCHLTRYLSELMMEKTKLSGTVPRVRFGSTAPRQATADLQEEEEGEASSRKRKNERVSASVKKSKFSGEWTFGDDSSSTKTTNSTVKSPNTTNSHNSAANSYNTSASLEHSKPDSSEKVTSEKAATEQKQTQHQFDISPLVDRPLYLFVPPDNLPETARFQRGFAIASADDSPFTIKQMEGCSNTVTFFGKGNNEVPGSAFIEQKEGNLSFGRKKDSFQIEKFKRGVAVKHNKKYIGLKRDLKLGVQEKPFEFVLEYNFAPVRHNTNIEFFVDGEDYFTKMYTELVNAKTSINIFDWMFSHETHLIRPLSQPDHELGALLIMKASQGVQVNILLYKNIESLVPNNHKEVVKRFHGIKNISVKLQGCFITPLSRWSHHQKGVVIDYKRAYIGGLDLAHNRWDTQKHLLGESVPGHHPGPDYRNPFVENVKRNQHPRMPWHDVQISLDGEAAFDVAINFIQRWNVAHEKEPAKQIQDIPKASAGTGSVDCQITRSMRSAYCGEFFNEKSICTAYVSAISTAKSFVYIESQYFIENVEKAETRPIINALCDRIVRAKKNNEPFTVVVILPQLPDNGNPEKKDANLIMKYQFATMQYLRSEINLLTFNADDYINFYTLRNHQLLDYGIVTEAIYVHAKLLITDEICIVGSANLNDRSMSGTKDSEIAAVVFSAEKARELLLKLVTEHSDIAQEPSDICQFFRGIWKQVAKGNTTIYKEVFGFSIADGEAPSFELYKRGKSQQPNENAQVKLHEVKGHLVLYPYNFLINELQNFDISQLGLAKSELCL